MKKNKINHLFLINNNLYKLIFSDYTCGLCDYRYNTCWIESKYKVLCALATEIINIKNLKISHTSHFRIANHVKANTIIHNLTSKYNG
jgi:hypothetical protein